MIQFFKRLRLNQLGFDKTKKYLLYAFGEILLIVILIAVQISNKNLEKQAQQAEIKILKELNSELKSNLRDLEVNLNHHILGKEACEILADWINDSPVYNDTMKVQFGRVSNTAVFIPYVTSYENLKSVGISVVKNDSIRILIGKIFNFDLNSIKELENKIDLNNWYKRIEPYYDKHFIKWQYAYSQTATPKNYSQIIKDPGFEEIIFQTIQAKNVMIFNYKETIKSISNLIKLIEKELKDKS